MTEDVLTGRQRPLLPGSLGVRVALAINLLVLVAGVGFLAFDYRRESRQRLADKKATLNEQATTVLQAVSGLRRLSDSDRQGFLGGVYRGMDEDNSSGRHLVVEIDGRIVQSQA